MSSTTRRNYQKVLSIAYINIKNITTNNQKRNNNITYIVILRDSAMCLDLQVYKEKKFYYSHKISQFDTLENKPKNIFTGIC